MLKWTVHPGSAAAPAATEVVLVGELDDTVELAPLAGQIHDSVVLNLEALRRISSGGVREWFNFLAALKESNSIELIRCSPAVVLQLNTIYNFRGKASVRSFFAPYICESCGVDGYQLVLVEACLPSENDPNVRLPPRLRCVECGGQLLFDELPERYLSFLRE